MAKLEHDRPAAAACLADKIGPVRFDDDDVRAVEGVIARFAAEHKDMVRESVATLATQWQDCKESLDQAAVERCIGIAHDLGGFGQMLGFPLVTQLCRSLNRFLRLPPAVLPRAREVAEIHVAALRAVAAMGITGDGGAIGRQIADELARAIKKFESN